MQMQQGDVLLNKVNEIPNGCVKRKSDNRGVVLAEGEHTGHFHVINDGNVCLMDAPDGRVFLVNNSEKAVTVNHQEHKPITVPNGIFEIGIVKEYDYFEEMERNVID